MIASLLHQLYPPSPSPSITHGGTAFTGTGDILGPIFALAVLVVVGLAVLYLARRRHRFL